MVKEMLAARQVERLAHSIILSRTTSALPLFPLSAREAS